MRPARYFTWVVKGFVMSEVIYVALLDEGVPVWRPVPARLVEDSTFMIERPTDYDADVETWEFPPGSTVICERRSTPEGVILAAVRLKERGRRTA